MNQTRRLWLCAPLFCFACATHSFAASEVKPPVLTEVMTSAVAAKAAADSAPAPVTSPVMAATPPAAMPPATGATLPPLDPANFPVLAKIKEKSQGITYDYLGQRQGLEVWVVSGPGIMQVIYTLPNNQGAIIGGTLIDGDGKELSTAMQQEFIAKNPQRAQEMIAAVQSAKDDQPASVADVPAHEISGGTASQKIWTMLEKTGWISFGSDVTAPALYAVLDPYQPQSRALWAKLVPLAELNKIRLYVIPVATTKADTVPTIIRLLGDADRAADWRKLIVGESLPPSSAPANPQGALDLKNNVDLMQTLRLRAVPVLLYQRHNTGLVRLVRGMPKDWAALEAEVIGAPAETLAPAAANPPAPEAAPPPSAATPEASAPAPTVVTVPEKP